MRFPIFGIVGLVFLLTSCTLPGTQTSGTTGTTGDTVLSETNSVKMQIPKTWTLVKATDVPSPRVGTVEMAYTSPDVKYGFSNNIIVLRDTLTNIVTSRSYSELNNIQTTKNYLEYTKLRDEDFTFADSETSRLYVFEARYNTTTPLMKFIQVARVCGTSVYLLHVSLTLDKVPDNYVELLKTFSCK